MAQTYTDYPDSATNNAKRALQIRKEEAAVKDCGTRVGWTRANQLANKEPLSRDTVARMASFARHRKNSDGNPREDCGALMWLAWGGTSGVNWAINKMEEIRKEEQQNAAKINVFGDIAEYSSAQLQYDIANMEEGKAYEIVIESAGGDVFAGQAMAGAIRAMEEKTYTRGRGLVASIATVVLLAGDIVTMEEDAMMMIHNAWAFEAGDSEELRKTADLLDKISDTIANVYVRQIEKQNKLFDGDKEKTKQSVLDMMKAETWLTANEALEMGLIDEVVAANNMEDENDKAAMQNYKRLKLYAKAPKSLITKFNKSMKEETPKSFMAKLAALFGMAAQAEAEGQAIELPKLEESKEEEPVTAPKIEVEQIVEALKQAGYNVEKVEQEAPETDNSNKQFEQLQTEVQNLKKQLLKAQSAPLGGSESNHKKEVKNKAEIAKEKAAAMMAGAFNSIRKKYQ